jgi:hypothetical protein
MGPEHVTASPATVEGVDKAAVGMSIENPITKRSVDYVELRIGRAMFGPKGSVSFKGTISFDTGPTTASHRFEASSLEALLATVRALLGGLPE